MSESRKVKVGWRNITDIYQSSLLISHAIQLLQNDGIWVNDIKVAGDHTQPVGTSTTATIEFTSADDAMQYKLTYQNDELFNKVGRMMRCD
ncbi:MAG: hypothetical protein DRH08_14695 [Deltaproteobacteria bacterium]|nr:MAG: hypothetical protein DRH08_14695 [Deltaproteobacteria bacterium]